MKKVQVLGPGCPKCVRLAENLTAAAEQLGVEYTMQKVTDIQALVDAGVMRTPVLVVDGTVKVYGRVPSVDEIKAMLA
jgi:small redox-active disulfide protein 2